MPTFQETVPMPALAASDFCYEMPYDPSVPVFQSGEGINLKAVDGRLFIDGISSIFVTCFGHSCEPIMSAAAAQLRRLAFSPPLHGLNEPAMILAHELALMAGPRFDCVKLVNGGSEAIEAALRIVRLYHRARGNPQKTKILSSYNGYHGSTYGSLSLTGRPDVLRFEPRLPGFIHFWPADCLACPFDRSYPECQLLCASMIERSILSEGSESVGAMFIEPMIHLLGMATPPVEWFKEVQSICRRHDVLMVFDEIVTGFGRTGQNLAAQTFEVEPDIICVGKGISGGYAPLSAVIMSEGVSAALRDDRGLVSFAPSHTYAGNPVASAAGLAAMRLLCEGDFTTQVCALGKRLEAGLRTALGARAKVRGLGLLYGIKLGAPDGYPPTKAQPRGLGKKLEQACLRSGLIIRGESDWVVVAPAYITEMSQVDQICAVIGDAADEIYRAEV